MKKIYILLIAAAVMLNFTACSEDKPMVERVSSPPTPRRSTTNLNSGCWRTSLILII